MPNIETLVEQSKRLKQSLLDFVLDAEGETAMALESFSADRSMQWSKSNLQGVSRVDLAVDMFLTEGQVAGHSILDIFIHEQPDLQLADRDLLRQWHRTFNGLFAITRVNSDSYELMNWLTEKHYRVQPNGLQAAETLARLSPGEIVMTRLMPITEDTWTFSGPLLLLGKLGKPKLAVAIGNFKNWFPHHLYGDAPELLEEAWKSVERYHQEFVDFFGGDRMTLSGKDLNQKLNEYQQTTRKQRLAEIGIDSSKSLNELAAEAGVSEEQIADSVAESGEDSTVVRRLLNSQKSIEMVMPSISLPDNLRRAEAVTVFVHPRWGQTFLPDYVRLTELLQTIDANPSALDSALDIDEGAIAPLTPLVIKYLKDDAVNAYIWRCLADETPNALEIALRHALTQPDFQLQRDLDTLLVHHGKSLTPQLPEIASVPIHLHNLFQEALQEVGLGATPSKDSTRKNKAKSKKKPSLGFGA